MALVVVTTFSALVIAVLLVERALAERRWTGERHALLNRVQHPAVYQAAPTESPRGDILVPAEDEYELAGRILEGAPENN